MKQRVKLILPAYNEEENLPALLKRIEAFKQQIPYWDFSVLLVNDGSQDRTVEIGKEYQKNIPLEVLDFKENRGLGVVLKEGLKKGIFALNDDDVLVVMDADDTHNPFQIERMVKLLNEGWDLVIASRYQKGARVMGVPFLRQVTSYGARFLFQLFFPIAGVRDYTCGFRAYRVSFLKKMWDKYKENLIEETGFSCMAELLLKMAREGALITEIPLFLRYDRKKGESKIDVSNTIFKTLKLMWRIKANKNKLNLIYFF